MHILYVYWLVKLCLNVHILSSNLGALDLILSKLKVFIQTENWQHFIYHTITKIDGSTSYMIKVKGVHTDSKTGTSTFSTCSYIIYTLPKNLLALAILDFEI